MAGFPSRLLGSSLLLAATVLCGAANADPLSAMAIAPDFRAHLVTRDAPPEMAAPTELSPPMEMAPAAADTGGDEVGTTDEVGAQDDDTEHASSGAKSRTSGASIGEGGRDLVPRLRWVGAGALSPFVALELYGDAGPCPMLLGPTASYVRSNPVLAVGLSATPTTALYLGAGGGGAMVGPSADNVDAANVEEAIAVTGAAFVGARFTGGAYPMVLELRADVVAEHGAAGMLNFAIEVAD